MKERTRIAIYALVALVSGCKAKPAKVLTPFFGKPDEKMIEAKEVQTFHKAWFRPDVDWDKFKKIYIAPVNTKYLRQMTWWEKTCLAKCDEEGIRKLAEFTRQAFIEAHKNNKHKNRLIVVDKPDDETVILEIALTEVVPTKAWLNAVSFCGIMMSIDKGCVAIEARLRDGATGEIIAKIADREKGKTNLIGNVKDFTWYGHVKAIIREWAKQSVEINNADWDEIIKDSSPFELKVW